MRYNLPVKTSHIRPLDSRHDLSPVADLIEICFTPTLDSDGREYLRHIRRAAADPNLVRWTIGRGERVSSPLFGYVWEENHRILGNLSLIPIYKGGRWLYMIANVAVHPDHRRRGIARELTMRAIDHIRKRRVSSAWLQVRDDNIAAYNLYASIGFTERSRRSTWVSGEIPSFATPVGVLVTEREKRDWPLQRCWLDLNYPLEATWNMSFDPARYHPSFLNQLWRWMNGDLQTHWAARYLASGDDAGQPLGFITWEPVRGSTDMLWVASPPENDETVLRALLPHALHHMRDRHRPLGVNYPDKRGIDAFQACNFTLQNTLIWMEYPCK